MTSITSPTLPPLESDNRIVARWRKPVKPLMVADDPGRTDASIGRETQGIRFRLHPDDVARIKQGYVCMNCLEPHETAWPTVCQVCRYPIRTQQPSDFQAAFGGLERDKKAQNIREGLDRVDDTHERRFHTTKTGIVVPTTIGDRL